MTPPNPKRNQRQREGGGPFGYYPHPNGTLFLFDNENNRQVEVTGHEAEAVRDLLETLPIAGVEARLSQVFEGQAAAA